MRLSVSRKPSRSLLPANTSISMSKGPASAGDQDFDSSTSSFTLNSIYTASASNEISKSIIKKIMNFYLTIFLVLLLEAESALHPEAKLSFLNYCKHFKYPAESHQVVTQDGYVLTLFRIQKKGSSFRTGLKPILLQHGLLDSSDTWFINDENKAPAFMFVNRGYDVWLGNSRGNKHSRKHTRYDPDKDKQFWQFTFQHMADFDLPAVFSYLSQITSQKIHYIGHSQGTVQMHIALSKQNPVVETSLDKYFALGPIASVKNAHSHLVSLLDKSGLIEWYHLRNIYQFLPSFGWFESDTGILFCATFPKVCGDFLGQICDADPSLDNSDRYDVMVGHNPSGTSVMNMEHWKQAFDRGNFQAFDYGTASANTAHYGQPSPPVWDIKKIRVPVRLIAGSSDLLADPTDVEWLWDTLPEKSTFFFQTYNSGHVTYIWGKDESAWMNDIFQMLMQ